ncbi:exodeoxyribonuclease VII large subunit [Clostridium sp. A1-XYC3]|uniref:Exodeoxyribonuclease 7 large subunit n=1 Tax=Clostridium tanneri TaxID=3037988 RepID=A0ABU4JN58_9CLOT|nr:exodeoxyribonuclease VII large subunit [Clostridium sp. A1-XYC3]MDW8799580.1 exodeoxyribonuclease VII large subunit [Clostridium sp. A1-XYC3]
MYIKTLTISEINKYIKKVLDNDFILSNSSIKGEISNFKLHSSGHMYFSLKDENSKINCIMFKGNSRNLTFLPENGMKVIVKGRVSLYEKEGAYQFYCDKMELEGIGELYIAFEKLKNRLELEGLFKDEHKKAIPKYVQKIGVITSPTGAAIKDIINVTKTRNKSVEMVVYPALVQGINASKDIIKGIEVLNKIEDIDLIILARGGGSIEELWCFNDEELAYAVYNSKKPIITGVGHEIDYTIVDFVSDRRAATPSQAAEIAVFSLSQLKDKILFYKNNMSGYVSRKLAEKKSEIDMLRHSLEINSPTAYIVNQYNSIDRLRELINLKTRGKLEKEKERLIRVNALLSANNPLNILNKGYAIIEDKHKNIISEIHALKEADSIKIILKDGEAELRLEEINEVV